jgi:hypothetical protein
MTYQCSFERDGPILWTVEASSYKEAAQAVTHRLHGDGAFPYRLTGLPEEPGLFRSYRKNAENSWRWDDLERSYWLA